MSMPPLRATPVLTSTAVPAGPKGPPGGIPSPGMVKEGQEKGRAYQEKDQPGENAALAWRMLMVRLGMFLFLFCFVHIPSF